MTDKSVVPEGMVEHDGEGRPIDYDGGPVMMRNGKIAKRAFDWGHYGPNVSDGDTDIIAYTPTPNPLSLETSDLDPITPEEDAVATAIIAAVGRSRQSLHTVVRAIRDGLATAGAVIVPVEPTEAMIEAAGGAEYDPSRWDDPSVRPGEIWSAMLSAHSIQSGGEGGEG